MYIYIYTYCLQKYSSARESGRVRGRGRACRSHATRKPGRKKRGSEGDKRDSERERERDREREREKSAREGEREHAVAAHSKAGWLSQVFQGRAVGRPGR